VLLLLGLGSPAGAALAAGTMLVAGYAQHAKSGSFWNAAGGGEFPYVVAAAAVVVGFTGPGLISLDAVLAPLGTPFKLALHPPPWVAVVVILVALLTALAMASVINKAQRAGGAGSADLSRRPATPQPGLATVHRRPSRRRLVHRRRQ